MLNTILVICSSKVEIDDFIISFIPFKYPLKESLIPTRGIKGITDKSGIYNSSFLSHSSTSGLINSKKTIIVNKETIKEMRKEN